MISEKKIIVMFFLLQGKEPQNTAKMELQLLALL